MKKFKLSDNESIMNCLSDEDKSDVLNFVPGARQAPCSNIQMRKFHIQQTLGMHYCLLSAVQPMKKANRKILQAVKLLDGIWDHICLIHF